MFLREDDKILYSIGNKIRNRLTDVKYRSVFSHRNIDWNFAPNTSVVSKKTCGIFVHSGNVIKSYSFHLMFRSYLRDIDEPGEEFS